MIWWSYQSECVEYKFGANVNSQMLGNNGKAPGCQAKQYGLLSMNDITVYNGNQRLNNIYYLRHSLL